jgi:DNA-binding transcriptional regulator YdaS (Cro superfamily)
MAICRTLRPTWPYLLKGLRAGQSHSEWPAMPINSFARELCEASSYQSSYHLAA